MRKKVLSLFLALALLIGQTPAVFAFEGEVPENVEALELVTSEEVIIPEQETLTEDSSDEQTVSNVVPEPTPEAALELRSEFTAEATAMYAAKAATSGACGDNLTWTLSDDGVLTISGTGTMTDWDFSCTPWYGVCNSIETVLIEEGVTNIGRCAFESCTSLTSITIPEGVETIAAYAFSYCEDLTSVNLPESLTSIGNSAFENCESLESMTIPEGVASLGNGVFELCYVLKNVTLPESLTSIGQRTFSGCAALESAVIPNGVTYIGNSMFYGCESLESVTIPQSVTTVESYAFDGCTGLTDVYYGGNKTAWNAIAVSNGNMPLTAAQVHFAESTIASGTCGDNLTWTLSDDGTLTISGTGDMWDWDTVSYAPWYDYSGDILSVVIESGVTSIGDNAFINCYYLTSVVIPNGVTKIGDNAFCHCWYLESVVFPESVKSIGHMAFNYCGTLTSVTIPKNVKSIGYYAFGKCTSLESVTIEDGATDLGESVFCGDTSLTSVTIPKGITRIPSFTFYECDALTDVYYGGSEAAWNAIDFTVGNETLTAAQVHFAESTIASGTCGDNLTWTLSDDGTLTISGTGDMWDYKVEYSCSDNALPPWYGYRNDIQGIIIGQGVTRIGSYAFAVDKGSYAALEEIHISDTVRSIGRHAFSDVYGEIEVYITDMSSWMKIQFEGYDSNPLAFSGKLYLNNELVTSLVVPEDVTEILDHAFNLYTHLESVTFHSGVKKVSYMAFNNCLSMVELNLNEGLIEIEEDAFNACFDLEAVTIPSSVEKIGYGAFGNCNELRSVVIREGAVGMESSAFSFCYQLEEVSIPTSITTIEQDVFDYCDALTTVYYGGNKEQWDEITIKEGNDPLLNANIVFAVTEHIHDFTSGTCECGMAGVCGDYATWEYAEETKTLTISGTGDMYDYWWDTVPWFDYREEIVSVVVEAGITSIGDYAFYSFSNLADVDLADSITSIGRDAFGGCLALTQIDLPENLTTLGLSVFSGCEYLESVTIPNGVTTIGSSAFSCCYQLTEITIPASMTEIPGYAFADCVRLRTVSLPNTLQTIGNYAFRSCAVQQIDIPDSVTNIGEGAFTSAHLTEVKLPANLTVLDSRVFENCTRVTKITLPDGLTSIGGMAFYNCSQVKEITIPKGVTYIGGDAFKNWTALTDVYYFDTLRNWNRINIKSGNKLLEQATLHTICDITGEHTPGEAATCTTPQKCTACYAIVQNAKGHTYTEASDQVVTVATCVTKAVYKAKCAECNLVSNEVTVTAGDVDINNHTGNDTSGVDARPASCTEAGYTGDTVCECGTIVDRGKEVPATGHHYDETTHMCDCGAVEVFTVTWMVDGEVYATTSQEYGKALVQPEAPFKHEYNFSGWTTAAEGGEEITEETVFNGTDDTTVYYAQFALKIYQVRLYGNGGIRPDLVGISNTSVYVYLTSGADLTTLDDMGFVNEGYVFDGWKFYDSRWTELNKTVMDGVVQYGRAQWKCAHTTVKAKNNGNGTHKLICTGICGGVVTAAEEHDFKNDAHTCICGAVCNHKDNVNVDDGKCTTSFVCSVCDGVIRAAAAHKQGTESVENLVPATCIEDGSYDSVIYCTVCAEELSRETKVITAPGHTEGTVEVEKEVAPTCENEGSYDNVVYCTVCNKELSRETIPVPALDHVDDNGDNKCDACGGDMVVVISGDINGDGQVNSKDLVRLRKYFADPDNTEIYLENADVNLDGFVNSKDLVRMRKHFADGATFG